MIEFEQWIKENRNYESRVKALGPVALKFAEAYLKEIDLYDSNLQTQKY